MKRVRRRLRISESIDAEIRREAAETGCSYNEAVSSALAYYYSRDTDIESLWVAKFTRVDDALEEEDIRIHALANMFLYFMQTYFYVHPEIGEGYAETMGCAEATRVMREWFSRMVRSGKDGGGIARSLRSLLSEEEDGGRD